MEVLDVLPPDEEGMEEGLEESPLLVRIELGVVLLYSERELNELSSLRCTKAPVISVKATDVGQTN